MEQIQNRELDIQQMKKIAHEIFDEEITKNNLDVNVFPVTFVEYYKDFIFKDEFSLQKTGQIMTPLVAGGFNDLKGNIVMFLNYINKIEDPGKKAFRLAEVCYHELRHSMQEKFDDFSYEGFLRDIDHFVKVSLPMDYIFEHDSYSYEIGANLYGVRRAKEFLQNKYPPLYEKEKEDIEKREKRYLEDYMLYDAANTFDMALSSIRSKRKKMIIARNTKKDRFPLFDIFMNEDGSFKKISEMMKNEKFNTLDKRIVAAILSSKTFLKETNMEELSLDELSVLNDALNYTNQIYKNQEKFLEEHEIINGGDSKDDLSKYLKSQESLAKKIAYTGMYGTRAYAGMLYLIRSEEKRREHVENVPDYLENTKKRIKQKNNSGFVLPIVCFLVSFLISIATIVYLIFIK